MYDSQRRSDAAHVGWIDCAKGFTIVLVVMLYANEWAQEALDAHGWLDHAVAFAAPFRMPDFFLISGLLLSRTIQRDWRTYLDRKVVHFAYFYVLWLTILVAFEAPWTAAKDGWIEVIELYAISFVRPYSMLWFIYLLPVFFVVTKLGRHLSVPLVWLLAAVLHIAQPETGIKVLDKLTAYYVFFYSGYVFAPQVFRLAGLAASRPGIASAALALWALFNLHAVISGYAGARGLTLALGLLGAGAIIVASSFLYTTRAAAALAYCGRNTIVIYLGFYIPLAIAGKLAVSVGGVDDPAAVALLATAAGIGAPLLLHRFVRGTRLAFLFERPEPFWLVKRRRGSTRAQALAA